ncbi:MAG: FAD-dependent thymidylate synthase [Actinomycetota bacterium]|nr:FAD-dependent thymidylate synthase [Actinomycetota bacterium]
MAKRERRPAEDERDRSPPPDVFSPAERAMLSAHVTNIDGDVFALRNLPEVVKGALFARYSRSPKSLRRLFLDEFAPTLGAQASTAPSTVGLERAEALYERVLGEYGDDSVAQLGGAHVAVERASNLLTKQLEWGRLAAYLEQSTRYVAYDDLPGGRYRYYRDPEVLAGPHAEPYLKALDAIFTRYAALLPRVLEWVRAAHPHDPRTSDPAWRRATKAKALDLLRGLLPAATTSNLGIFADGQAYEQLLLRLRASELAEARACGDRMLIELRKVIPSFLSRVDRPDRGGAWSEYLATTRASTRALADRIAGRLVPASGPEVSLVDWARRDPFDAEVDLVTAMLYPAVTIPEGQLRRVVAELPAEERRRVVAAYVGERGNRRHKPGRAFERVWYRFDILGDYGAFRDLQRHRMLTIEWQDLTTRHGYDTPPEITEAGVEGDWHETLERSAELYERLLDDHPIQAQYAVCFAYRVRYVLQLNARSAMHVIELRSSPQGHATYRRVVQRMHELVRNQAGHELVADAMTFVDRGTAELERLASERRADARRTALDA